MRQQLESVRIEVIDIVITAQRFSSIFPFANEQMSDYFTVANAIISLLRLKQDDFIRQEEAPYQQRVKMSPFE